MKFVQMNRGKNIRGGHSGKLRAALAAQRIGVVEGCGIEPICFTAHFMERTS
jgi:hypothetical protein